MSLWIIWSSLVAPLVDACKRRRTRLWFLTVLIAFTIRKDTTGVTSFIRALGLKACFYDRILDFFNSASLGLEQLTNFWVTLVFNRFPLVRMNNRPLVVADGLKRPKTGRRIPAVKKLHQESGNNNKPEYIWGHSLQALSVLVWGLKTVFCVPLTARIHEGLRLFRQDRSTLMDRLIGLLRRLPINESLYIIADAYYSGAPILRGLLESGHHLISRMRSNTVAYRPINANNKRKGKGRPKKYGAKVKLKNLFKTKTHFTKLHCWCYGEKTMISARVIDLVLRRVVFWCVSYWSNIHGAVMLFSFPPICRLRLNKLSKPILYDLKLRCLLSRLFIHLAHTSTIFGQKQCGREKTNQVIRIYAMNQPNIRQKCCGSWILAIDIFKLG